MKLLLGAKTLVFLSAWVILQASSADDVQVTYKVTTKGPYDSHYAIYPSSAITTDTDQCAQHGM